MIQIPLHNSEQLLLVEVPEDAYELFVGINFNGVNRLTYIHSKTEPCKFVDLPYSNKGYALLGTYLPESGKIDFEVSEDWVERHPVNKQFGDEVNELYSSIITKEISFITKLQVETQKAYPLKENPYGKEPPSKPTSEEEDSLGMVYAVRMQKIGKWRQAQSQVMPKKFVVLKVRK